MKILMVGSGGREHSLAWKISQSLLVEKIYCAPGNPGTEELEKCENIAIKANQTNELLAFSETNGISLVVVGPEDPLAAGISDVFEKSGIPVFGPSKKGAKMEASKSFAKKILKKANILTARYKVFTDPFKAKHYLTEKGLSVVTKADGLTGGKGVFVFKTLDDGLRSIEKMMVEKIFGGAGKKILIEEKLRGEECSFLVFTDGKDVLPLDSSMDHKALLNHDEGPNTGGMGVSSPGNVTQDLEKEMLAIAKRLVTTMREEGIDYRGLLYIGFMICNGQPYVLEINCRFGDPETQPLMVRMKSDIVPIMLACANGDLQGHEIIWDERSSVCLVLASEGYGYSGREPKKGKVITGLKEVARMKEVYIFHAGTKKMEEDIVTNGGRILCVTALGKDMLDAKKRAYRAAEKIHFEGKYHRMDIPRNLPPFEVM